MLLKVVYIVTTALQRTKLLPYNEVICFSGYCYCVQDEIIYITQPAPPFSSSKPPPPTCQNLGSFKLRQCLIEVFWDLGTSGLRDFFCLFTSGGSVESEPVSVL